MKKIISLILAFLFFLSVTSCIGKPKESQTDSSTSPSSALPPSEETSLPTQGDLHENPETISDTIGQLYTVMAEEREQHEFTYQEGTLTPELIAGKLGDLTGLNFSIYSTTKPDGSILVNWQNDSTLLAGLGSIVQKEEFFCYDADSLSWFMMDSLCDSIRTNMNDVEVYYAMDDGNSLIMSDLPNITIDPNTPYHQIDPSSFYSVDVEN